MRPREITSSIEMFAARTPTLLPATHTNSYALGGRDVVLVEPATPYADEQRAWLDWARSLASRGRRLVALVATHHHPDHVGGLEVLRRELGVPLWVHRATRERLDGVLVDRELEEGDEIILEGPRRERWRVLHTPGHAPGHVCLLEEGAGALVVGDMVASVGTILVAPGDGDMRVYLEQLERLAALSAKIALPAHGDPIDDPSAIFRRYVTHRLAREQKVLDAVAAAPAAGADLAALVAEAYADTPRHLWPIATLSLEAHLEKLVDDGEVVRCDDGSSARFRSRDGFVGEGR